MSGIPAGTIRKNIGTYVIDVMRSRTVNRINESGWKTRFVYF